MRATTDGLLRAAALEARSMLDLTADMLCVLFSSCGNLVMCLDF
jgi:hypothetical protein